jgi:hypothetical protein
VTTSDRRPPATAGVPPTSPTTAAPPPAAPPTTPPTTAPPTSAPPTTAPAPAPRDPFARLEAEDHDGRQGVTVTPADGGGAAVAGMGDGDHIRYDDLAFPGPPATYVEARVASGVGPGVDGALQVRLHDVTADPFATIRVTGTGGWDTFVTVGVATPAIDGSQDLYVTFASDQGGEVAVVDWVRFGR